MSIQLFAFDTPNGRKISVALEEMGLPYQVKVVNITKDDQFKPDFLRISPNNKIPAIIDPDGPDGQAISVFESGAILMYLAEKTGRFLPVQGAARVSVMEWLMFQMGGIGPMFGQAHHFLRAAPQPVPYAIERYTQETRRLYKVLDHQLEDQEFIAGDYSIADIATYPWIARHEWHRVALADFPSVQRWFAGMGARPAVQQGMAKP